uniref:Uncharacterized protein n=1 Tax=Romanomermis culicivorax TaxID=13658 RepID=A0A915ILW1_ROMCU
MESAFGEHMIKCVILDDDNNDQCIIGTNFLAHPDIHAILNFKDNYTQIQDMKLPLKQWVTSTVFPTTTITIPDVIVQPLPTNSIATELPIETTVVNITNSQCPLVFVNNMPNSIKLHPNQLLAVAKHVLGFTETSIDCQVATTAADRNLTDHEPTALDKSLPCHTDQQKLDFALFRFEQDDCKNILYRRAKVKSPRQATPKPRCFQPSQRQTNLHQ